MNLSYNKNKLKNKNPQKKNQRKSIINNWYIFINLNSFWSYKNLKICNLKFMNHYFNFFFWAKKKLYKTDDDTKKYTQTKLLKFPWIAGLVWPSLTLGVDIMCGNIEEFLYIIFFLNNRIKWKFFGL